MQAARGASLTGDAEPTGSTRAPGRSRYGLILGIGVLALLADQGTKALALARLDRGQPVEFIGSLLRFNLTSNPGAAFSTGTSLTPYITVFGCVALVVVLVVGRRVTTPLWAAAMGLLLAGISGNLLDRFFREPGPLRGHVIDFLELPNWPIFNVADICINVAAGLIILQSLRGIPLSGKPGESDA